HATTHLYSIERRHPFKHATLSDDELSVNFAEKAGPNDRVAVVVTAPLTNNEEWTAFESGELKVFVDGQALPA
ncbi:MAG: class II glutamine amidotransferase, partial [Burkholderiales bacterium]